MKMRTRIVIGFCLAAALIFPALADLNYTEGDGTTRNKVLFDFICFTTKHCSAHVPINSSGTEIGTGSNPIRTDTTGSTTQPVSASALPLPTGAATSANQSSQITQETATATALGAPADAAYSGSGSGAMVALLKWIGATLTSINTNIQAAIAAGTNYIGQVGIDPSKGGGTPASVAISISTATTTQLIAASGSTVIYVTSWDVVAGGTGNITLQSADTGGACANPVALTGAYPLVAQAGISKGNGSGTVLKLPSGKALCALTSAAVQMSGSAAYQQF